VDEYIHACLDAHIVGCGDELAIRGQAICRARAIIHWTLAAVRLWPSQTARVPSRAVSVSWLSVSSGSVRPGERLPQLERPLGRLANRLQLSVEPTVSIG